MSDEADMLWCISVKEARILAALIRAWSALAEVRSGPDMQIELSHVACE
jgi:hypothetical protein